MARLKTSSGLDSFSWWTGLNLRLWSSHQLWLKWTDYLWAAGSFFWLWDIKLANMSIVSAHTKPFCSAGFTIKTALQFFCKINTKNWVSFNYNSYRKIDKCQFFVERITKRPKQSTPTFNSLTRQTLIKLTLSLGFHALPRKRQPLKILPCYSSLFNA